jgi:hypothetical protein
LNKDFEIFLKEKDIARITLMSLGTVRRWRLLGQGPEFTKIGAAVRYSAALLSSWLESRPTGGERGVKA